MLRRTRTQLRRTPCGFGAVPRQPCVGGVTLYLPARRQLKSGIRRLGARHGKCVNLPSVFVGAWVIVGFLVLAVDGGCANLSAAEPVAEPAEAEVEPRLPPNTDDARYWLDNMVAHHRFSAEECAGATGLTPAEIEELLDRFHIRPGEFEPPQTLRVLPYPGGRHPRLGFRDGAVRPQRETKVSVFTPWDDAGYVVADVPEAVWSNLGLTYLAHTHVDTIWTKAGVSLPVQEWERKPDGSLAALRELPNGIVFGCDVQPGKDGVRMEMWLKNGTPEKLSDLRVQMCVMLGYAPGFSAQSNDNKVFESPYTACHDEGGRRWIISAWSPCDRAWGNAPCPCLHSDPKFPDCAPGEMQTIRGWLSFYEGLDVRAEFARLSTIGWERG